MECICEKERCTGCGACANACPKHNIKLIEGVDGFRYANCKECDENCGLFVCPQNKEIKKNRAIQAYALQLKDEGELVQSTSGGAFVAISRFVLDRNGVVFGAVYKDKLKVCHRKAENIFGIIDMKGSKYVQSDITKVYKQVLLLLKDDRYVLFTGMPCQIAGIKSYLKKDYPKLITMDVVCSGVPSQKLFDKYIEHLEQKKHIEILDYKFRDKRKYGCSHTMVMTYQDKNGRIKEKTNKYRENISYYVAFGLENCFMPVCYHCQYNSLERVSDFTVGGFWNLKNTDIKLEEKKGVSLVLCTTSKSLEILSKVERYATAVQCDIQTAIIGNRALTEQTPEVGYRDDLYANLERFGYADTEKKYFKPVNKCLILIKKLFPNDLKAFIKRLINNATKSR